MCASMRRMTPKPAPPRPLLDLPLRPVTGHDPLEGISANGTIVTGASPHRMAPAFKPVILSAVERVSALSGRHSLYVYGSVATGTARVGPSDVDLLTVGLELVKI